MLLMLSRKLTDFSLNNRSDNSVHLLPVNDHYIIIAFYHIIYTTNNVDYGIHVFANTSCNLTISDIGKVSPQNGI